MRRRFAPRRRRRAGDCYAVWGVPCACGRNSAVVAVEKTKSVRRRFALCSPELPLARRPKRVSALTAGARAARRMDCLRRWPRRIGHRRASSALREDGAGQCGALTRNGALCTSEASASWRPVRRSRALPQATAVERICAERALGESSSALSDRGDPRATTQWGSHAERRA